MTDGKFVETITLTRDSYNDLQRASEKFCEMEMERMDALWAAAEAATPAIDGEPTEQRWSRVSETKRGFRAVWSAVPK